MNICFYNVTATTHFGGLETYCWEAGHALAARGHRVTIIAGEGGAARQPDVELAAFPFIDRTRFPNLGTRFRKLMERLSFARRAAPYLASAGFDAVIINKPFDMPALGWARWRGMSASTMFRSGGTDFFLGDRWFAAAVDHWVSTSRYNADQITTRYHRPVTLIPNGVDTRLFVPGQRNAALRRRWSVPEAAPLVISVGRLVGWKGLHVVVDALAGLGKAHYLIVGEGGERRRLEEMARRLGIADRVHFTGRVSHDQLPETLREADLFVQPSIGEEAFGISVVEAMACGVPVLASRNGGLVEVVEDGKTGRLLPPGDAPAWRAALAALLAAPETRMTMGQAARERADGEFTWAANARKLEQLIMERTA
ncbi:MAG TPA: glycosyltransferase family 1 protein [Betaproteobacteria bacterium]|nr:glycosyltransferase family 1 protein [Betaproteobacteria bacterium]